MDYGVEFRNITKRYGVDRGCVETQYLHVKRSDGEPNAE